MCTNVSYYEPKFCGGGAPPLSGPIIPEIHVNKNCTFSTWIETKSERNKSTFSDKHVVQPHQLRVGRIVILDITKAENGTFLDFTQNGEQSRLHAMAIERVFTSLCFVQTKIEVPNEL